MTLKLFPGNNSLQPDKNGWPEIKPHVVNWLNEFTPGWSTDQLGGILWIHFKSPKHKQLALNTWQWHTPNDQFDTHPPTSPIS